MAVYYLFRFKGNMPAGDVFEHTLGCSIPALPGVDTALTYAAAALTALTTTASGVQSDISTNTVWAGIDCQEVVIEDGSINDASSIVVSHAGTANPSVPMPGGLATCVTLRTAHPGPSGRGRFYLPAFNNNALTSTGRMHPSTVTHLQTSLNAFFASFAGAGTTVDPVVYSRADRAIYTVTSCDFGDVYDSQRRRRNKLVESRTSVTV